MKGSLIIVSFFLLGTLCGLYDLLPPGFTTDNMSYYALCALMFSVGISIGNDPNTLKSFRSLNPRLVLLPVMTILGTLSGCAVVSLFLGHRSAADCMAVGSGFGYYSLSSIFITEYKGAELGTIALLSNIMREIIALLCAARKVLRTACPHFRGRSDNDGYHPSDHYPLLGTEICDRFHLSRFHCGFQCPLPSDIILFHLGISITKRLQKLYYTDLL